MVSKKQVSKKPTVENTVSKEQEKQDKKEQILHTLEEKKEVKGMKVPVKKVVLIAVVIIIAGIGTGFILAQSGGGSSIIQSGVGEGENQARVVGYKDVKGKDSAEGLLIEGGIDGEGTHHLERDGGPSKNVYITSSVVPLDGYMGKKVKVWGDTFDAQNAGWLMDVVKLEVLE